MGAVILLSEDGVNLQTAKTNPRRFKIFRKVLKFKTFFESYSQYQNIIPRPCFHSYLEKRWFIQEGLYGVHRLFTIKDVKGNSLSVPSSSPF